MTISALNRKLLNDIGRMKGQSAAIAAVICCGIAIYIGWQTTAISLQRGLDRYYENQRFADVFTSLNRAPLSLLLKIRDIPGVESVDARIVKSVTLDLTTLDEPALGRLISLPDKGEPVLNGIYLKQGRLPERDKTGEVVAEEAFAKANSLLPGDTIQAVMNGRLQTLQIVGVGLSPEFITTIQPGSLFPDDKRFGIFWMRRNQMENAFDMDGAFNDLSLTLQSGVQSDQIVLRLDRLLDQYGSLGANDRSLQSSHSFISDELSQLKAMALIPPAIFLGVAAFLLNVVLKRVLSMQRTQIATLKAFGYSSLEVGIHYGKLVGIVILGGVVAGGLLGTKLGDGFSNLYADLYRFPGKTFDISIQPYLIGAVLGIGAGYGGVIGVVRQAVRIQPAEAMRPEAPPTYRQTWFERLGWHRVLSTSSRMILRELMRRPLKAGLTSIGIAFACAVVVIGNFGKDAIDFLVDFQFGLQQRQDATVNFIEAIPRSSLSSFNQIKGVMQVEPFRSVPVKMIHGQYSRQLGIMGLMDRRDLFRLIDEDGRLIDLPPNGLVVSSHLANIFHLKIGAEVTVEILEADRLTTKATVVSKVSNFSGVAAYMHIDALNRMLRDPPLVSGAFLKLDPAEEKGAYRELKDTPMIAAVSLQKAAYEGFMESFAKNMLQFRIINVILASVIAIGVVYNSARISLSERSRELSTLRVIGFTKGEATAMLLGELAILTCIAIPVGWLIGYGMSWGIVASLPTEHVRIPLVLSPSTYGFAALVIITTAVISSFIVRNGVRNLDLVSVLKSSE